MDGEIRDQVLRFVDRELSLAEFEDWFVGNTWDERSALAVAVDHALIERESLSPAEFVDRLQRAVETVFVEPEMPRTSSRAQTIRMVFSDEHTTRITASLEYAGT